MKHWNNFQSSFVEARKGIPIKISTTMKKLLLPIFIFMPILAFAQPKKQTVYDLHQYIKEAPVIMLEIAQAHQELNNYDSALYYLDKSEAVLDDKLAVQQLRGVLYREAGKYDLAIQAFYALVETDSDSRPLYMEEVARTYYEKKSYNQAVQIYLMLSQDNPDNKKHYLYKIGICYNDTHNMNHALRYFKRAAKEGNERAAELVSEIEKGK